MGVRVNGCPDGAPRETVLLFAQFVSFSVGILDSAPIAQSLPFAVGLYAILRDLAETITKSSLFDQNAISFFMRM